jgi:ferredoxin
MASDILPVLSDPTLLDDIRQYGRFDSAGCYQCGTCTVSCELVSDSSPSFPRKSIRYALLGLRGPLLANLEPWLCEDCGDCSIACPRQAEPRISMVTLRRFLSARYDWTGLASKLLTSRAWYLGSLVFVGTLVMLLILCYHLWYVGLAFSQLGTPLGVEHMFPLMTYYTLTVILLPVLLLLSRVFRIWRLTMTGEGRRKIPVLIYLHEAWVYVYESATESLLHKCPEHHRWLGHCMLAIGTSIMLAIKLFGLRWFQTDNIYPFYHPQRLVGYFASALILYAIGDILVGRLLARREIYKETRFPDLVLPVLLLSTVISGLVAHVSRYLGFALTCHFAYAMHVVIATPMLVVEMSLGKGAHMIYRPLAIYFQAVRERSEQQASAQKGVGYAA